VHRAWLGPLAFCAGEPELDVLTAAWTATGTGAIWKRLVYETQLAQRVSTWTTNGRIGGEVHVARRSAIRRHAAHVRAILDEECARGIDERSIARAVTRREANTIWSLTGLARRASIIQRHMLYKHEPDALASELARLNRTVTPESIDAAIKAWLDPSRMVEIETTPK